MYYNIGAIIIIMGFGAAHYTIIIIRYPPKIVLIIIQAPIVGFSTRLLLRVSHGFSKGFGLGLA